MAERRHFEDGAENFSKLDLPRVRSVCRTIAANRIHSVSHLHKTLRLVPLGIALLSRHARPSLGEEHMRESQDSSPALLPGQTCRGEFPADRLSCCLRSSSVSFHGVEFLCTTRRLSNQDTGATVFWQSEWLMLAGPICSCQWVLLRRRHFRLKRADKLRIIRASAFLAAASAPHFTIREARIPVIVRSLTCERDSHRHNRRHSAWVSPSQA
jgi:hypothetical protein